MFVRAPFQAAAALRGGARVFHPRGLVATGHIELGSPWWTLTTGTPIDVVARLSGGVGTPSGVPDVLGLALKIPLDPPDAEWDLLLASSGTSAVTRILPLPARGWSSARYSSLMPYSSNRTDTRWVLAVPVGPHPATTSLDALRQSLADSPLRFRLDLVSATGSPVPAGQVTLTRVQDLPNDEQPTFDPVLHCPPGLALRPAWLAGVRVGAYRGSRHGRGEPSP
ncbi:hypothetical protein C5613_43145 [Rhodococcus opacus]|uniref:Phosphodiesterase n=1 Tax=Rhodococcus opacus TaxID=37919 RepID=A0A2S8IAK3_RHOOP|nr:hypothetical protein C5613_43145 [Rhodococcus opacus]